MSLLPFKLVLQDTQNQQHRITRHVEEPKRKVYLHHTRKAKSEQTICDKFYIYADLRATATITHNKIAEPMK